MSDSRGRFRVEGDDRAVSNVVGVVLVVAVVVVLAAAVGNLVLGFGGSMGTPAPQFTVETHYQADGAGNDAGRPYLNVTHTAGDTVDGTKLFVVDSDGNDVAWADIWTGSQEIEATEHVHIDGHGSDSALNAACEGETYQLIYRPDPQSAHIVQAVEIERQATGSAATYC